MTMSMSRRILLVEDDQKTADYVLNGLRRRSEYGYYNYEYKSNEEGGADKS